MGKAEPIVMAVVAPQRGNQGAVMGREWSGLSSGFGVRDRDKVEPCTGRKGRVWVASGLGKQQRCRGREGVMHVTGVSRRERKSEGVSPKCMPSRPLYVGFARRELQSEKEIQPCPVGRKFLVFGSQRDDGVWKIPTASRQVWRQFHGEIPNASLRQTEGGAVSFLWEAVGHLFYGTTGCLSTARALIPDQKRGWGGALWECRWVGTRVGGSPPTVEIPTAFLTKEERKGGMEVTLIRCLLCRELCVNHSPASLPRGLPGFQGGN